MRLLPGLFWTLTNDPFLFFSVWWPEKAETALPDFLGFLAVKMTLWNVGRESLLLVCQCVQNREVTSGHELGGRRITCLR